MSFMSFIEAVQAYFLKWNDFRSRSSRSEYWWAILFVIFAPYIAGFVVGFFIGFTFVRAGLSYDATMTVVGVATLILDAFFIIALTCLTIRRLHDVGRSGWWCLIGLTIIGMIPLLIWLCTKSTDGSNRFGEAPLGQIS